MLKSVRATGNSVIEEGSRDYSYGLYLDGQPKAMVMVLDSADGYRLKSVKLVHRACEEKGVTCLKLNKAKRHSKAAKKEEITMNMSVSSIVSKDGKREIYVLFTEGSRSAEGRLSDYKMISNKGFTPEEVDMLEAYMRRETDRIVQMAKNINVMDAFLNG